MKNAVSRFLLRLSCGLVVAPGAAAVMENSTGGFEVQIDNFLEHFKRTSKAMEQANEGCPLVVPPVPPRRRISSNTPSSGSRPTSLGKADGFDCLEDFNSEGRYCDLVPTSSIC